jgi:hypothetical protein
MLLKIFHWAKRTLCEKTFLKEIEHKDTNVTLITLTIHCSQIVNASIFYYQK